MSVDESSPAAELRSSNSRFPLSIDRSTRPLQFLSMHFSFIGICSTVYIVPDRFVYDGLGECVYLSSSSSMASFIPVSRKSNQLPWPTTTTTLAQIAAELTATAHE